MGNLTAASLAQDLCIFVQDIARQHGGITAQGCWSFDPAPLMLLD